MMTRTDTDGGQLDLHDPFDVATDEAQHAGDLYVSVSYSPTGNALSDRVERTTIEAARAAGWEHETLSVHSPNTQKPNHKGALR